MNFVFSKIRCQLPKYAVGERPHVINIAKVLSNIDSKNTTEGTVARAYIINMLMENEFRIAAKKRKSCIVYINSSLDKDLILNIKSHLEEIDISVGKFFLVDTGHMEKCHHLVDGVIKRFKDK